MVQHANRGHQVKPAGIVGNRSAVEDAVFGGRVGALRLSDAGSRNVDAAEPVRQAAQVRMQAADAAPDIEHLRTVRPADMFVDQSAQQVGLRLQEKTMRQAGELDRRLHGRAVTGVVLVEQLGHAAYSPAAFVAGKAAGAASGALSKPSLVETTYSGRRFTSAWMRPT